MSDTADYDKHSDEELALGIQRADEQEPRIEVEGSEEQHDANRRQRDAMQAELEERDSES